MSGNSVWPVLVSTTILATDLQCVLYLSLVHWGLCVTENIYEKMSNDSHTYLENLSNTV